MTEEADHADTPNQERPPTWRGFPMGPWLSQEYVNQQLKSRHGLTDLDEEGEG